VDAQDNPRIKSGDAYDVDTNVLLLGHTRRGKRQGGRAIRAILRALSQFEHAGSEGLGCQPCILRGSLANARSRLRITKLVVGGVQVMGIKTDQALAPLCDLGGRQLAALSATIVGIALASLILFG
jgi:hypothetical protein